MGELTLRDYLAKGFLYAAFIVAPRQMKSVLRYVFEAASGVPDQINSGRDGGVIIAPWFISEAGSELAHEQMRQCFLTAGLVRQALRPATSSNGGDDA